MMILYIAMSVDGCIADEEGRVAWLDAFQDPEEDYGYSALLERTGVIVMGRRTFDQLLTIGPWPYGGIPVFVVTRRPIEPMPGADVRPWAGSMESLAEQARAVSDKDVWLVGGAEIVALFAACDLIDQYLISVIPVLLGSGTRLCSVLSEPRDLAFEAVRQFPNGVIQIAYTRK